MKNLFGISRNNDDAPIMKYVVRELPVDEKQNEELKQEGKELGKKEAPRWLTLISTPAILLGALFIVMIFGDSEGVAHAIQNNGSLLYIGIFLVLLGIASLVITFVKNKKINDDPEVKKYIDKVNNVFKERELKLNIPDTAITMDVIYALIKIDQEGNEKIGRTIGYSFFNQDLKVFIENDLLCFADTSIVVGVPVSSIVGMKKIEKNLTLPKWNKEEKIKSPKYKPFKLRTNGYGLIYSKPYYEVYFKIDEQDYYMYLPVYEKDNFINIIGQQIKEL